MDLKPLVENAKLLGLQGEALREYVEKEKLQIMEREERAQQRELRKFEMEMRVREAEAKAKEEVSTDSGITSVNTMAKIPKLPNFDESKDDIDSYLQRFERFANAAKWSKDTWATTLVHT